MTIPNTEGRMTPLTDYAKRELELAGMYDDDADYGGGRIADCVLKLVEAFASQGHSGGSAAMTLGIFDTVARFRPLSPLTSDPSEWMEVGSGMWQCRRAPSVFSKDGGKTWYDLDEPRVTQEQRVQAARDAAAEARARL